jgi:hypothetical protein
MSEESRAGSVACVGGFPGVPKLVDRASGFVNYRVEVLFDREYHNE